MDVACVIYAGIEQGKVFLAKAKEFESAALESALAAQLEREGMQEQLRNQQQLLEDTVQVWIVACGCVDDQAAAPPPRPLDGSLCTRATSPSP